ncbi:probable disease resistance protein At4g27220 [Eucalyptus grandis]|uniref:probable disease resistance protein At4g27220 n=1 Tax=Eucalyptus grandis TaxID=71139 RepID=UPI00192F0F85|nr:probable disease resistance protein At4g27220 [Eucalyptus grandis]
MGAELATSVASNLVSKLGEYLIAPIGRQFGYVLYYKSYVEDLENGVKELKTAQERVEHSVDEAVYNGKPIHKDVENWLKSVKEETEKADNLLKHNESAKHACFRGWLPNPVVRHPIGRKVKKMTQVIQGLHDKSNNSIFRKVFYENTPIGVVTATTSAARSILRNEDVLESRASITEDVMKAIADDKVHVIGVYGPGGVGKSKLMEDIEKRVKEEQLFNVVATTNVSRNPDLKRIQGEIAYALGLKLTNEETTRGRANLLCKRLEEYSEKKILIILDNLWMKLELKEVGIPCGYDNKVRGCKLLLTSRDRYVLYTEMGSDQEFPLNVLEHEEAQILFERIVGDKVKDPQFKSLVDGVVKNCGGLPLLVLSVAKRLKRGDLPEWRNALTNIEGLSIKSIVELSYNDLEDERIKSLFLVLALHFGRCDIRDTLIYCMGLGLHKKFSKTMEDARDRLIMDLRRLRDSSLLLGSDLVWLSMHDLFIDVAISMRDKFIDTEWNALVGRKDSGFKEWSKNDLRKCTAMAFNNVGIDELPEKLDCPNMRILLLSKDNRSLNMPESFFESTEKLQVLDLNGLSFTSLPSSMELLKNLTSLCLDSCHLEDVTALGKLKGLQFLSFCDSTIARLPKEVGELTELRFLDLTSCSMLRVIEPGVLESLVELEELFMQYSFDRWEAEDETTRSNASLAEFKNMNKLSTLYIAIPCSASIPGDLPFGKLNKHRIELKHLYVQNSPSIQYVVHSENIQCTAFTSLESLFLKNLNNFEKIFHGRLALESFSKLKIVKLDNCGEIKHLFHSSLMRIFLQLEDIKISRCYLIKQIITDAKADEVGDEIDVDPQVKSCNLRRLTLQNLPELRSFYKTMDHSVVLFERQQLIRLQNLEAITVERCQLIREVFDLEELTTSGDVKILWQLTTLTLGGLPRLERIWNKNPRKALCFRNLKTLKVQNCESLRFLFSSSMAKALVQIKEIEIVSCAMMEEIVYVEEEELEEAMTTDTIEFPLLTSLSLEELPKLKTFSYGKYYIHCLSLTRLTISRCPKMMTFSSFKGRQQSMTVDTGLQQAFGCINSSLSLPGFFNEKVLFPSLEKLKLSSMCQLKRIWHNQLQGQSFYKLASLTVELCENLSYIFPSNSMDMLQSLNKIKATECPSLEALFEPISLSAEKRQKPLVLLALRELTLLNLSRLRDILKSDCKVTLAFPSLMEVKVRDCHSLPYLFSSATAETLNKLTVLDVSCCNNLQGIIAMEEIKGKP